MGSCLSAKEKRRAWHYGFESSKSRASPKIPAQFFLINMMCPGSCLFGKNTIRIQFHMLRGLAVLFGGGMSAHYLTFIEA
jgi:hypothetical protein